MQKEGVRKMSNTELQLHGKKWKEEHVCFMIERCQCEIKEECTTK